MDRFAVLVAVLTVLVALGAPCRAEEPEEPLETFELDDSSARTFISVNGSNIITTPNAVVGVTLIAIAIALLAGSAASAASMAAASSLAAGTAPGKYKRSLPDTDYNRLDGEGGILQTIAALEQQFRNFDVADVDCRKRIICEIHQEGANSNTAKRLGQLSDMVANIVDSASSPDLDDKMPFLKQYLEAANHGKAQKECSQLYNTCQYSIKKVLRNFGF